MLPIALKTTPSASRVVTPRQRAIVVRAASAKAEGARGSCRTTTHFKNVVAFPGEDAPGTGRRHFPETMEREEEPVQLNTVNQHNLITTEEYYAVFPSLVHTSCPLEITDTVPSGTTIQHEPDAGPRSGRRKRPEVYNTEPIALDPVSEETVEARLKELKMRRAC